MTSDATPLLGTTFYSFTNEWVSGQYTLTELLERAAEAGIGPGVEIVGFQSIRDFPHVSPEFVRKFRDDLDRLGLVPTSLGSNIDIALRRDRYLTVDERVEYTLPQIEAAKALGFPVLRIQIGADPETIERIVPHAEAAGVKLGMEIHAPEGAATPKILAVRETYERIGSDHLGFIPDFSSTMHRITQGLIETYVEAGLPRDLTDELQRIWAKDGSQAERLGEFRELARSRGVPEEVTRMAAFAFTMNGHEDPATWAEILPQVFHIHGKFYEIDESGNEPAIDYEANLGVFRDAGWNGSISSEWEAHSWTPNAELDTVRLIQQHHALVRRVFGNAHKEVQGAS